MTSLCVECGKHERATGALCESCGAWITGLIAKNEIERHYPEARVTQEDCIAATRELIKGANVALIPDGDGVHSWPITGPEMHEAWSGDLSLNPDGSEH